MCFLNTFLKICINNKGHISQIEKQIKASYLHFLNLIFLFQKHCRQMRHDSTLGIKPLKLNRKLSVHLLTPSSLSSIFCVFMIFFFALGNHHVRKRLFFLPVEVNTKPRGLCSGAAVVLVMFHKERSLIFQSVKMTDGLQNFTSKLKNIWSVIDNSW